MQAPDTKPTTEQIRFDLTNDEIAGISRKREGIAQDRERLDEGFTSLKLDYKAKAERLDLEASELSRKIREGFEMRETRCEISFNDPERGFKTIRRLDNGGVIRVEAMTALDVEQRELPIETEAKPNGRDLIAIIAEAKSVFPDDDKLVPLFKEIIAVYPSQYEDTPEGYRAFELDIKDCVDVDIQKAATVADPHLTKHNERTGTLSQTPGADNAGETSVGAALDKTAISTPAVLVPLNLEKFGSDYIKAGQEFTKVAKKIGWSQTQISLIRDELSKVRDRERKEQKDLSGTAFAVLTPHVCAETEGK